jgi:hypothetical protein
MINLEDVSRALGAVASRRSVLRRLALGAAGVGALLTAPAGASTGGVSAWVVNGRDLSPKAAIPNCACDTSCTHIGCGNCNGTNNLWKCTDYCTGTVTYICNSLRGCSGYCACYCCC